jgi:tRNA nucleotidyltransferase (CCA-adding enzyme)
MDKILTRVLREIIPSVGDQRRMKDIVDYIIENLSRQLRKSKIDADVELGGSVKKNTYLDTKDIDFFVKFDPKHKNISKLLITAAKKAFSKAKIMIIHGTRDYVNFKYKKHDIELVPALRIPVGKAVNTIDISPYHANYILRHLKRKDQVVLLKKFCKANRLYGAESHIGGFSGYVLELLIIKYSTFKNLIQKAVKWKPPIVIDIKDYYRSKKALIQSLSKSKRGALIVIDPLRKDRNAAAALTRENFDRFVELCNRFLKKPSYNYFRLTEINRKTLRSSAAKRKNRIYFYTKKIIGRKQIFLAKLSRKLRKIKNKLNREEFKVYDYGFVDNKKVLIYFELEVDKLPRMRKQYGPPLKYETHVKKFRKKHKKAKTEKGKIVAKVKRKYTSAKKLLDKLIR